MAPLLIDGRKSIKEEKLKIAGCARMESYDSKSLIYPRKNTEETAKLFSHIQ